MTSTHDFAGDAAAYLLGSLEPQEAEAFRQHLETCPACQEELSALQPAAGALPLGAPQHAAPRELRRRVMAEVNADARRTREPGRSGPIGWTRRNPLTAGALALAAAALAFAGGELGSSGGSGARVFRASVGDAQVRLAGGQAQLIVHHLPEASAGHVYEVWIKRPGSPPVPANSLFDVDRAGRGSAAVPGDLHGVSEVLVTQEPSGGTQTPTTQPVIVAPIA
jgi:anti-sigma factor RsiW